ncbi:hypothetical protein CUMW_277770 [Citrus unshiu]|uniref:Uncharacterized protein n=2 Tax=Citrus TaxID=2706 RepID=A0A2H5N4G7_CITUN|nr:hypothetical protein CUMW_277770 [Citrus unshiu]
MPIEDPCGYSQGEFGSTIGSFSSRSRQGNYNSKLLVPPLLVVNLDIGFTASLTLYWVRCRDSSQRIAPITSSPMSRFAHEKSFYSQFRGETLLPDRRGGLRRGIGGGRGR